MTSKNPLNWHEARPSIDIDGYCDQLNRMPLTQMQNVVWVVIEEPDANGELIKRLEKRNRALPPVWKPSTRELQATAEIVAQFVSDPTMTQAEFNRYAQRGIITQRVQKRLAEMG